MVSILALYEYSYGIENAPDEIKKQQLQRALAQLRQDIPVADLSIAAAAKYGELKYRRKRQLLGPVYTIFAAPVVFQTVPIKARGRLHRCTPTGM